MSKFDKIFKAREENALENEKTENPTSEKKHSSVKFKTPPKSEHKETANDVGQKNEELAPEIKSFNAPKKRGRPGGKKTDPNFIGFTTYIRKDTHLKAKIALLQEGKGKELSELVEELISQWLKSR